MSTHQCPKCGSAIAAAHGATEAQCFGCGTVVKLRSQATAAKSESSGSSGTIAIVAAVVGLGLVMLIAVAAFFILVPSTTTITQQSSSPDGSSVNAGMSDDAAAEEDPPIIATEEERRLADTVPAGVRKQITDMWDQMTATTGKKVMLPKGWVLRESTESMLGAIEQRELTRMAALHGLEDKQVRAVIQVHMADASN